MTMQPQLEHSVLIGDQGSLDRFATAIEILRSTMADGQELLRSAIVENGKAIVEVRVEQRGAARLTEVRLDAIQKQVDELKVQIAETRGGPVQGDWRARVPVVAGTGGVVAALILIGQEILRLLSS